MYSCNVQPDYMDKFWKAISTLHEFCSLNLWKICRVGLAVVSLCKIETVKY